METTDEPAVPDAKSGKAQTRLRVTVDGRSVSAGAGVTSTAALVRGLEMIIEAGLLGGKTAVEELAGKFGDYVTADPSGWPEYRRRSVDPLAGTPLVVSRNSSNVVKLRMLKWVRSRLAPVDVARVSAALESVEPQPPAPPPPPPDEKAVPDPRGVVERAAGIVTLHTARSRRLLGTGRGTEEATKMSLVAPVLQEVLGYDCHDPSEVVPEYAVERGEKVDYALMLEGKPAVLVEAKQVGTDLEAQAVKRQLHRHFAASHTGCRTAILTDGVRWHFYADLVARNRLDDEPYFVFDFTAYSAAAVHGLWTMSKASLRNEKHRLAEIRHWRSIGLIYAWLGDQAASEPGEAFAGFLARETDGTSAKASVAEFRRAIPAALQRFADSYSHQDPAGRGPGEETP